VRAYCDFYEVAPTDGALLALSRALIADRIGVMNDLFVAPSARGTGAAEALIRACVDECRGHSAAELTWQTARDNLRAQRVYDRVGGERAEWVDYSLSVRA